MQLNALERAVEHALINACAWWPGMRAEIIATAGEKASDFLTHPDLLGACITLQREEHPERFLPANTREALTRIEDPATRYAETVSSIADFRSRVAMALGRIRDREE